MTIPTADAAADAAGDSAAPDRRKSLRLERSTLLSAIMPLLVDLGSTFAFYAILVVSGDPRLAAAMGIALAIGQLIFTKVRHRQIAPLQWASIALVLVVGSLTLMTNDPRFVLVKATLVYGIIGATMLKPGWMACYIPAIAAGHLPGRLLGGFERAWAVLLLGTGALNLILTLTASGARTAQVMAIRVVASKLTLFAIQYVWCRSVARPAIKATIGTEA